MHVHFYPKVGACHPRPPENPCPTGCGGSRCWASSSAPAPFLGISADGWTQSSVDGLPNQLTALLVVALAQGKFYLLFAFLFGYSSSFILRDDSTPNRRRFRRRLLALALIGSAHAVFFFVGDILSPTHSSGWR